MFRLVPIATLLMLVSLPRTAAPASLASAFVSVFNCGEVTNTGPVQAAAGNTGVDTTGSCASPGATASGSANFIGALIALDMVSILDRGVDGRAYLDDYLTFSFTGGGTRVVNVSMGGDWGGTFNDATNASFKVTFDLGLGPTLYQGMGYSNLAFDDGLATSNAFVGTNPSPNVVAGTWLFSAPWTIQSGIENQIFAGLKAQASNGATAHINDPLIITLPDGVTYTAASGRTYAAPGPPTTVVPEPATLLLLATGLGAARFVRRTARRTR